MIRIKIAQYFVSRGYRLSLKDMSNSVMRVRLLLDSTAAKVLVNSGASLHLVLKAMDLVLQVMFALLQQG